MERVQILITDLGDPSDPSFVAFIHHAWSEIGFVALRDPALDTKKFQLYRAFERFRALPDDSLVGEIVAWEKVNDVHKLRKYVSGPSAYRDLLRL